MARPLSDVKRTAILAAAARVIAAEGLGAPTAAIAREAGVSNGSLFTYFATKADLLNTLYLDIKSDLAAASLKGVSPKSSVRKQMQQMWSQRIHWAIAAPDKRRALAHLNVSDEITAETREAGHRVMAGIAKLMTDARAKGPMRGTPHGFLVALTNATADATIEFIVTDKRNAAKHIATSFEALWRMIA
ncbi:MAG: TetR/AcrR family transcriptional regulator [Proteobacteria bacterium]|nr:TetR/AcrR family transcriptional regulator [Pseudomonadota bacterium]